MSTYHVHSWPAILGGSLAAVGSCALLLADVGSLQALTVDKALMPVLVGLTVLTGHLAWQAWHELRLLSCAGLALVSVIGIGLTVTDAMGRRAEVRDSKVADVAGTESKRQHLAQMLAEASEILDTHRRSRDKECATGKGRLCDGRSYTVQTWEAAVAGYDAKLQALPAPRPADAKGHRVGAVAGLLGYSSDRVQAGFGLLEPFMLPALLELASIVLFGFGIAHTIPSRSEIPVVARLSTAATASRSAVANPCTIAASAENLENVVTMHRLPVTVVPDEARVLRALEKGGRARSQNHLGAALGISPPEVSRMLRNCSSAHIERLWDPLSKSNVIRIKGAMAA
jgi:uncharacterized membrane protein